MDGVWEVFEGMLRHRSEALWTGPDYTLTRQDCRRVFRLATYHTPLRKGRSMTLFLASTGRPIEEWRLTRIAHDQVTSELVRCHGIFYPGHEDITDFDRQVLWLLHEHSTSPSAVSAKIDPFGWMVDETYECAEVHCANFGWLSGAKPKHAKVRRNQLRYNMEMRLWRVNQRLKKMGKLR